ncbi:MAG: DUF983 domain-containing protein [Bradyrhizobium sp.]|nr:DUF983 domain-containing protein [Bradyrhizobium sp.]
MISKKSIWTGMLRGAMCRCPNCGEGHLYRAFLKPTAHCEVCGEHNGIYPSDDLPPYLTVFVVGHFVVGLYLLLDFAFSLPDWLQLSIWLPATALLSLALLPVMKGLAIGICWATDTVREPMPGQGPSALSRG